MLKTSLTDTYDTYSLRQWPVFCEYDDEQMLRKRRKFRFSFMYGLYFGQSNQNYIRVKVKMFSDVRP
jgi:hypothetical protein